MKIDLFSKKSIRREDNEDSLGFHKGQKGYVFFVADGVGSSSNPRMASNHILEEFGKYFLNGGESPEDFFEGIHRDLKNFSKKFSYKILASTLTLCNFQKDILRIYHVGDCRVYLLRGNGIKTLTKDQNQMQYLIDNGVLSSEDIKFFPKNSSLTSALGSESYTIFKNEIKLLSGDRLIVCSDGFYSLIKKINILNYSKNNEFDFFFEALMNRVSELENKDDATFIAMEF